jgi:hypothetical protein
MRWKCCCEIVWVSVELPAEWGVIKLTSEGKEMFLKDLYRMENRLHYPYCVISKAAELILDPENAHLPPPPWSGRRSRTCKNCNKKIYTSACFRRHFRILCDLNNNYLS